MSISRLRFENFTAFRELDIECSPGINIFVGPNGTGKTHILKAAYTACDISRSDVTFGKKLVNVFRPSGNQLGRLVFRQRGRHRANLEIIRGNHKLHLSFSNKTRAPESASVSGTRAWRANPVTSVYLPVKEMLANAPGFRSLYNTREIHFEEIYADLLDRAYLPPRRGALDRKSKRLLTTLEKVIEGRVVTKDEEFFHKSKQGNLEFSLLAEGMRKLALLWLLIQNGTLLEGSILFLDEPEANLNPKIMRTLAAILLELQRSGVQVFIATHDYVTLKEFDLQANGKDSIAYHSLYRDAQTRDIKVESRASYLEIHPNAIADTFSDLYDRDMERALS
ncbi:MAG: AAA family ATPase [bacterium]|nr:AAA family ATPase [bacterium]